MGQGNTALGMYQGISAQGLPGQGNQSQNLQAGYGSNPASFGAFNMGDIATQRAMMDAQNQMQQIQGQANGGFSQGGGFAGGQQGAMSGGAGAGSSEWMGQQNFNRPEQQEKKEEEQFRGAV